MQRQTRQNRQHMGRGSLLGANPAPRALRPPRAGRQRPALPIEPLENRVLLANYIVSTLTDGSDGNFSWGEFSLREAIELSNASAGADQIDFASGMAGTISLDPWLGELYVSGDTTINGPGYTGFAMTWVDVIGNIVDIPSATAILNSAPPAVPAPYVYQGHASDSYPYIDFGAGGVSPVDMAFPGGTVSTEEFALRASARVYIPAGTWTVALGTDDGFMLTIPGVTFTSRVNEDYYNVGGMSPDSLVFSSQRPYAHTLGTFTVPAGGLYTTLNLDMYENHIDETFEFFIAQNFHATFDPAWFLLALNGTFGWTFTNDMGWRPDELALTVSGGNATRVLHVGPNGSVIINDLMIADGYSYGDGGGIFNEGFLRLEDSSVRRNVSVDNGGGIYNANTATLMLEKSWIENNDAAGNGGGLANAGVAQANLTYLWFNEAWSGGGAAAVNWNSLTLRDSQLFTNSANGDGGAFYNAAGTLEIRDSYIVDNHSTTGNGGAIRNDATALLYNAYFQDNTASLDGGTIINSGGAYADTSGGMIRNSSAGQDGGGIKNDGTMTISWFDIENASAGRWGGAVNNWGELQMENSDLLNNRAPGDGGGIYNGFRLKFTSGAIAYNASGNYGGGLFSYAGNADVLNSTISSNTASGGGGIHGNLSHLLLVNDTIADNAANWAGGVYLPVLYSTTTMHNTLIARNTNRITSLPDDADGEVQSTSSNNILAAGGLAGLSPAINLIGTSTTPINVKIGPLVDNGGYTLTHALLPGSPALNAGKNAYATGAGLTNDQRRWGFPRFVGTVDIGAYEDQSSMPIAKPGGPYTIAEGQSLSLNGSASVNASSYAWDVNSDGVFTDATGATPTLTWAQLNALGINNGPASRNVSLRVTDAAGNTNTASTTLTVNNAPPTATFSVSAASINEGSVVTFKFTNQSDPSLPDQLDGYTYSYDLNGNGNYTDPVDVVTTSDSINPVMNESGIYSIHGRIIDSYGSYSDYTVSLTVKNLAPKVLAGPDLSATLGVPLTLSGSFTDVPGDGPWTATVSYGDTSTTYPLTLSGQSFSLSHTYTTAGSYSITVKVKDKDGGIGSDIVVVTVPVASNPTATLTSFATPVLGSSAGVNLVVRYSDNLLLNAATIGAGDISVLAPNGTILATTFVSKTSAVNAAVISATYSLRPPGGGVWDSPDNGLYQVLLNGRQVADTSSPVLYAAPRTLGSQNVNLSPVLIVSGVLTVYGTASGDNITLTTSGSTYSVLRNGITYSGTGSFTKVRLVGLEGNDILTYNGTLPGTLEGAAGDDILNGGSGGDQLYGGAGSDKLVGGLGNDTYWFESASAMEREEVVEAAGGGTDRLDFSKLPYSDGAMVDLSGATAPFVQHVYRVVTATPTTLANLENLTGGAGADSLTGNALVNALVGNAGNDILRGEAGNDVVTGGEGSDWLIGGSGNDTYNFATALTVQSDAVDERPGGGVDTLNFASLAATDPLWVDLRSDVPMAKHTNRLVWMPLIGATEIENVNGGAGNDQIWGNAAVNVLKGGSGNDWIFSRDAIKDMVDGGVGMDTAEGDFLDVITTAEVIHRA